MLALCLAFAALTVLTSAQPFPSFLLDTARHIGPDIGNAGLCCAAGNDAMFLAAWADDDWGLDRVEGARVGPGLRLLDPVGIDIGGQAAYYIHGRVSTAASGSGFLAAWLGKSGSLWRLVCALCDTAGRVVCRLVLDTSVANALTPAVAFNGSDYVVAWSDGLRAKFTRVSAGGISLDSIPALVCPALPDEQVALALAGGPGCALAVFERNDQQHNRVGLHGNVIMADGTLLDSSGFAVRVHDGVVSPSAAFDGRSFVVVWSEAESVIGERLLASRVTPSGAVLDTGGIRLTSAFAVHNYGVGAHSDTSLAAWVESHPGRREVLARRLDSDGRLLDSGALVLAPSATTDPILEPLSPSVVAYPGGFTVVWAHHFGPDSGDQSRDIVARRVTTGGVVLDTVAAVLGKAAEPQIVGDVSSCGQTFLAVWQGLGTETGHLLPGIYGARFSAQGARLDSTRRYLAVPRASSPVTAGNGRCWLVCWGDQELYDVFGVRLAEDGTLLDSLPIPIETDPRRGAGPTDACAYHGVFLVVWRGTRSGSTQRSNYLARVTADGLVLDTTRLTKEDAQYGYPRIAAGDSTGLVCWRGSQGAIWAAMLDTAGIPSDTSRVMGTGLSSSTDPKVSYGAGVYLLLDDARGKAWRVSPRGMILDSVAIPRWRETGRADVSFDGENFLVAAPGGATDVNVWRVSPGGAVLDSAPITLVRLDSTCTVSLGGPVAIATDSAGHAAVVLSAHEFGGYMAPRARAATFSIPLGGIEEEGRERRGSSMRAPTVVSAGGPLRVAGYGPRPAAVGLIDIAGRMRVRTQTFASGLAGWSAVVDLRHVGTGVYVLVVGPIPNGRKLLVVR